MNKILTAVTLSAVALGVGGCQSKADRVSDNISTAADNFQIERTIVFYNGITDKYVATVEGRCSLGNDDPTNQVSVTCKVGPNKYTKDYLHLSDNVTFFVLQTQPVGVSDYHKKIIFRPGSVVPDIDFQ